MAILPLVTAIGYDGFAFGSEERGETTVVVLALEVLLSSEVTLAPHFITLLADFGEIHQNPAGDVTVESSRATSPGKKGIKAQGCLRI